MISAGQAFARVSTEKDTMFASLTSQISYYQTKIQENPRWVFSGVFADNAYTGTTSMRPEFNKLMEKARNHEIGIASQELSRVLQMKDSNTKESFMSIISSYLPNSKVLMASIMNKLIGNTQVIDRNGFFDEMVGRFSTATLGFNVRSMLKQFGSFFTAWEKVELMNGLKVLLNPTSFWRVMKNRKYIMQNNPVFRYRVYNNGFLTRLNIKNYHKNY